MSEQTNISPKKKPVAADELSEEALDQVAGGPASTPSATTKSTAVSNFSETTYLITHPSVGGVTGQVDSSPKG